MSGQSVISPDVLSRYAGDAARDVDGVVASRRSVVSSTDEGLTVEVEVALEWGRSATDVGAEVQRRVAEYLERMTGSNVAAVDVVVSEVGPPPPK